MHNYSVEFIIYSENCNLNIEDISLNLGITPTDIRQRGEPKSPYKTYEQSIWGFSVNPEHGSEVLWDSLEDALESLLIVFMPLKSKIEEYSKTFNIAIWCGHFTSSFDGGPTFSPQILKKLGEFGVELFLDTYCRTNEDNSNEKGRDLEGDK
jgi:hypothetical protein